MKELTLREHALSSFLLLSLLQYFTPEYLGHRCSVHGCGETIVIDGNMKNHRDVCSATMAGYMEYMGLPGRVTTGCTNTPDFKSRYCSLHKPTVSARASLDEPGPSASHISEKESQVGMILSKRCTRTQTMYQVLLNFTCMVK